MKSKKASNPVSSTQAAESIRNWQLAKSEALPDLFYAYDKDQGQTERIVTFRLEGKDLGKLLREAKKSAKGKNGSRADFRFVIHLGLDKAYLKSDVFANSPYVRLFLQARNNDTADDKGLFTLNWDPNPNLESSFWNNTDSGIDAIPGAAAFLFVHAWLETPHAELADLFASYDAQVGKRVRAYRFSNAESLAILAKLDKAVAQTGTLCIHFGRGLRVASHPVAFRPILEVIDKSGPISRLDNGDGDDDDGFYDFTLPVPPGDP